jgi:NAD(P)-dependent dehydrogenase (short-subunit alcohol dehydrogenase family)
VLGPNDECSTRCLISGACQGIGAGLVVGYRRLGYAVVANSRTITASDDPMVLTVPGGIVQPDVGQRVADAAMERFERIDTVVNNAGIFVAKAFTHPARLTCNARYRCGSGRLRTKVGHQNHGPRSLRMHGTTNERTISVSSSRPMHTVEPT